MRILSLLLLLGQVLYAPVSPDAPYFCGRKCNCGQGRRQEVTTDDGKVINGVIPPVNYECTCAELYRCDPQKEGAPPAVVTGKCRPQQGLLWNPAIITNSR